VPALAPFGLTDLPLPQRVAQVLIRTALLALLAVTAAGPRQERVVPRPVQVVHADRSLAVGADA